MRKLFYLLALLCLCGCGVPRKAVVWYRYRGEYLLPKADRGPVRTHDVSGLASAQKQRYQLQPSVSLEGPAAPLLTAPPYHAKKALRKARRIGRRYARHRRAHGLPVPKPAPAIPAARRPAADPLPSLAATYLGTWLLMLLAGGWPVAVAYAVMAVGLGATAFLGLRHLSGGRTPPPEGRAQALWESLKLIGLSFFLLTPPGWVYAFWYHRKYP